MDLWGMIAAGAVSAAGAVLFLRIVADEIVRKEREVGLAAGTRATDTVVRTSHPAATSRAETIEVVSVDASEATP